MQSIPEGITRFTPGNVETWYRSGERRIFLSDVVDARNGETMSVGFARYAPGESNEWVVTYDEALVVTRGVFTVTSADGVETTARAGEVIFLRKGTPVVYSADEEGAEVVYVTYPHWLNAQRASAHATLLERFQPTDDTPPPLDHVALLQNVWGPIERGESDDLQPFFDLLADDVVFRTSAGEARGKQAVIAYFTNAAETLESDPFVRPSEYLSGDNRVVQFGEEIFTVRKTGETHRADWAWAYHLRDGQVTRILAIEDLSGVADEVGSALAKAREAVNDASAAA